ncbi:MULTISPECIES: hypothetical protein [Sorangium]|uniref:Uncharacterized protein n=1 Tax=Sorangium atrum TaxID=2995308 RepID=A0ABT5C7W8_9BACT|nr:hypothetical protein [Sorangium aterium]MDC0682526.1 hypothetical protein [Sorangium aterium]
MEQRRALVIIAVRNGVLAGAAPVRAATGPRAIPGPVLSRARGRGAPVR